MKRFLATLALTCVLSSVALAGDIDTCGLTADQPTTTEPTAPGHVPTSDSVSLAGSLDDADLAIPTAGRVMVILAILGIVA
jgi:hypothetical protein